MLLALAACTDDISLGDETGKRPHPDLVEHIPGDTSPEPVDTDDSGLVDDGDDSVVFDTSFVHEVALDIPADSLSALSASPYDFVPAGVTYDGESRPDIRLRIKGRLGSLRYLPSKSAFKLDFLVSGKGDRLHGVEKLNLNNQVQDCSKMSELAAYAINEMVGVPAPRVAYAHVTINGEEYGVYTVVEEYDDEFLKDHFADPSGNLYDGDYYLWPNGNYTLIDFNTSSQQYFALDEGTDVALADIDAVTQAVAHAGESYTKVVGTVVDLDQFSAFFAAAAWTGHYDSYAYYDNNYRVYFDPAAEGKAKFLPWDPDWAFYASTNLNSPYGLLAQGCLAEAACKSQVSAYLATLSTDVPAGDLPERVQAAIDLVEPYLVGDPKRETSMPGIHACQTDLLDWFDRRGGEIAAYGL